MNASIVVGSGLAGCMVVRCLVERGEPVILVDESTSPGGLLGSSVGPQGLPVDYGTHYVLDTGPQKLVDFTREVMADDDWVTFTGNLPEASFYRGVLDHDSGCLDAKLLDERDLWQSIKETFERVESASSSSTTLEQMLVQRLGPTITDAVYAPLMRKLFGADLSAFGPAAMKTVIPLRIRMFDREVSRALKKIPQLDEVLAYEKRWDHSSDIVKYYPRKGGIGRWVTDFLANLERLGANVRLGDSVASFDVQGNRITQCSLKSGDKVDISSIYWTVSPAGLAKALAVPLLSDLPPPTFRDLFLVHFAYRGEPMTEAHYVYNFDSDALPYRITLYSNISDKIERDGVVHGTAECLIDPRDADPDLGSVMAALNEMGLFSSSTEILETTSHRRPRGLIVPDQFLRERAVRLSKEIDDQYDNCILVGTAREPMFGQTAILEDVAKTLGLSA